MNEATPIIEQVFLADPELIERLETLISVSSHIYASLLFVIGIVTSVLVLLLLYKAWKILF